MLVHICCAIDSHYFLQKLIQDFPNEELVGFFYDPNIHPYSEYYLRLLEVKRSCKKLGIELIEGEYDYDTWLNRVRGFENEPEKGKRCSICFDHRFEVSAKMCADLGHKSFTSTLLTSPKKSLQQLKQSGEVLAKRYGIEFVVPDYRKKSGTQLQNIMAKEAKLYRQDYCGCIFGLKKQRQEQNRLEDELFVPISKQIQYESIEERINLYERRVKLEDRGISYRIIKERFLNWRLLYALLRDKNGTIPSHILPYSTLKGNYTRGKVESSVHLLHLLNRSEVAFLRLNDYNMYTGTNYKTIYELIFNPPTFESEISLRRVLKPNPWDLGTIVVVEDIPIKKIELKMDSRAYEDVRERIILS